MEIQTSGKSQALMDKELIKILLVEDDAVDCQLVKKFLAICSQPLEFAFESVGNLSGAIKCLTNREYDIVIADLGLPDSSGIETVQKLKRVIPDTPIVVLTGMGDEEMGLSAIRNGASDYLIKNLPLDVLLVRTIRHALEHSSLEKEAKALRQQLEFILGATKTGLDIIDSDFNLRYIDAEWQKVYGEYKGKKCYKYFMERNESCPNCGIVEALKTKRLVVSEQTLPKEDNRPIQITTVPFKDEKGNWLVANVNVDITERKQTEERLRASEEKFKTLYESSRDAVMILTAAKGFIGGNPATLKLFGCKDEKEFTSKTPADLSPQYQPDGMASAVKAQQMMATAMKEGSNFFEWTHKRIDGKEFLATVLLTKMELKGQTILQATVRDITDRKKAEELIRQAAREWQRTFDSISDLVFVQDKDFNILKVNKAFAEAMKLKPEDIIGKKCYEVVHAGNSPWPDCPFERTKKDREPHTTEVDDPNVGVPLLISISPVFDDKGEVIGSVHIAKDITASKKLEEQLLLNRASFYNIVEKSTDGVVVVNKDGIVQFVNHAAEALFGRKSKTLVGEMFGFPVVGGEVMELDVLRQNMKQGTAEMRVVKTRWEGQEAWLALLRDITERKEMEEKLKETMKMKSEFISTVSHELRTPLTSIKGGIDLVLDGMSGDINEEQKEVLGISKKNVDRLARLINNVLDSEKLESGRMKFDIKPNNINDIVRAVYEMFASTAKDTGIKLLLELDDNLPEIGFDSDKITQVLTNLVNNALKFAEKGNVIIKTTRTEDDIQVSISDTGCGIRKEDVSKLFNRFEQLGSGGDRKTGGTGLGLAISKELIEKHNGTICVESTYGKGTTFTFTLPIHTCGELIPPPVKE